MTTAWNTCCRADTDIPWDCKTRMAYMDRACRRADNVVHVYRNRQCVGKRNAKYFQRRNSRMHHRRRGGVGRHQNVFIGRPIQPTSDYRACASQTTLVKSIGPLGGQSKCHWVLTSAKGHDLRKRYLWMWNNICVIVTECFKGHHLMYERYWTALFLTTINRQKQAVVWKESKVQTNTIK